MKEKDIELIKEICSSVFDCDLDVLKKQNRKHSILDIRNIVIFTLKYKLNYSPNAIGKFLNKNRTTILHSINTFKNQISIGDDYYISKYSEVERYLNKTETNFEALERQTILNLFQLGYNSRDISKFFGKSNHYISSFNKH